jgi:ribonuclease-3
MYKQLQLDIFYTFKNKSLLTLALTHSSFNNTASLNNNERLEFLGDRILGFVVADIVYNNFPNAKEGTLAKILSYLASKEVLVDIAYKLNLDKCIKHKATIENNILADSVEALFAAVYLDSDFKIAQRVIKNILQPYVKDSFDENQYNEFNPKSFVQNWVQQQGIELPQYIDIEKTGEEHKPIFTVKLVIKNYSDVFGSGESKKIAQKNAALEFIKHYIQKK